MSDLANHSSEAGEIKLDGNLRLLLGYVLKRASYRMQSQAARELENFGLRITTYSALSVICQTADLSQSDIAQSLQVERSNTVQIIDALEDAGLIERHRVPTDRRSYALRATPEGHRVCTAASAALAAKENEDLAMLNPQERQQLMDLLLRIF